MIGTSGPEGGLIAGAMGTALAFFGVKIIVKRETKAGPKGGPYQVYRGKDAVLMGLGLLLIGFIIFVVGIFEFTKPYR
jgi:hypothetical protein